MLSIFYPGGGRNASSLCVCSHLKALILCLLFFVNHGFAQEEITESATWRALLHLNNSQPLIQSDKFLLSFGNFSLQNELDATLKLFEQEPLQVCRFPARALFLFNAGLLSKQPDFRQCHGYNEFLEKAPASKMSIVYSSENLFSASSMMGHILLKTEGVTQSGLEVEHGVSFFTQIDSINIPKVIYESLYVGKHGFFQITPYQEKLDFYLNAENRNVWEYQLDLSQQQLDLLQAHFWELGNADLPYFFHTYNCATVTQLILRIVYPELDNSSMNWLSPLDVVKNVHALQVVKETTVLPPTDWKMRMLQDALPTESVAEIKKSVQNMSLVSLDSDDVSLGFATYQLALTYNEFLMKSGERSKEQGLAYSASLNQSSPEAFADMYIDLSDYKSPLKTPDDAQLTLGIYHELDENWLFFEYLPAGRSLEDDNRQFFSENELNISSVRLAFSPENQKLRLDHWQIYSMRSIIPYDVFSGGLSSQFRIGFEQHRDRYLNSNLAFNASVGTGLSSKLLNSVTAYAGINVGAGYGAGDSYVYFYPEVGLILYEKYQMKTTLLAQRFYNLRGENTALNRISWRQSFFIDDSFNLVAEFDRTFNRDYSDNRGLLKLKYFY